MRLGMFIVGGILGAAAAVYMNRNKSSMLFAGQSVGNMVEKAKSKFTNFGSSHSSQSSENHSGLNRVEDIVNKDANLKTKVNEIMSENQNNNESHMH